MNQRAKRLMLACTASCALIATPALAQDAAQSEDASQAGEVDDVIVTAQRRDERLQDVPISVTAVNAQQLQAAGVESAVDLRQVAPALNSARTNGSWVTSNIRGIGSFGYGVGVESPVATYVDGVYYSAPFVESLLLNNIEAVEVLKGPQGTLFGRNATAGLIHIRTARPTSEPSGNFELGYGSYDTTTARAYIAGGLSENFAADFSAVGRFQGEGYGRNRTTGQDTNQLEEDLAFRSQLLWTPSPDTEFRLIADYFSGEGTHGDVAAYPGFVNGFTFTLNPDLDYDTESDYPIHRTVEGGGLALQWSQSFGGGYEWLSTTAGREASVTLNQDLDFTPNDVGTLIYGQDEQQFSQEFQLNSPTDGPFQWTAGLYYYWGQGDYAPVVVDLSQFIFVQGIFTTKSTQVTESLAAYAQGAYELTDNTNLTVGLRYTEETRTEEDATDLLDFSSGGGPIIPIAYPDREISFDNVSYRISLDHRFSDEVLAYASFNTGFKSGGFNSGLPGNAPYQPEELDAYEIGLKMDLLDRRLRLNVAGFYNDYTNMQVQGLATSSLIIRNGPSAEIYGVDADFTAILNDNFSLTGGFAWLSPEFGTYLGCASHTSPTGGTPLTEIGTDCTGNQIPGAAEFTSSLTLNYGQTFTSGELEASANVYYNSGLYYEADNVLSQDAYATLGATVRYTFNNGVSVGAFGRNLTDERVKAFAASQQSGNTAVFYQDPLTYGVTVGYRF